VRGSAGREGSNPLASCGERERERRARVATSTFSLENEKGINLIIYIKKKRNCSGGFNAQVC
jgi:hypothetical protein